MSATLSAVFSTAVQISLNVLLLRATYLRIKSKILNRLGVVKVINRKGGGLIHFSGLLLNNQEEMKNLKEVLYHSHYHFNTETVKREVERLGDLAVVGSCRYAAGPYEPLYQGD